MTGMKRPNSARLKSIAKRYGLRLVILFGSQVTGRTHPDSDVDVAVWLAAPLNPAQRTRLWADLSTLFQADIDLTVLNRAEPLLLNEVATRGRLLYESKRGEWSSFKGYAFRYYQDAQKYRDDLACYVRRELQDVHRAR
jgi:predicted nucleotidyltransferase